MDSLKCCHHGKRYPHKNVNKCRSGKSYQKSCKTWHAKYGAMQQSHKQN
uniref:Uncharacterized protein n=1 Tax=Anguilla anguilla TaxID=7936 RepID=A0A0E9RBC6_ANGAN